MIYVVGIGPGKREHMTIEAIETIRNCDNIIGYKSYIDLIRDMIEHKQVFENGMKQEVDRCRLALDLSREGNNVAVISGGDSGVYGRLQLGKIGRAHV